MVLHQYSTSTLVQYRGGVPVQRETLLTCLSCNPCAQILSSRSQRPCMRVFSCSPAILASPWPCSIPWPPILSTSIRLVCTHTHTHSLPHGQNTSSIYPCQHTMRQGQRLSVKGGGRVLTFRQHSLSSPSTKSRWV